MVFSFLFEFLFYLSLRLGHTRGLTVHWTVIQYPRAASLPSVTLRVPHPLEVEAELSSRNRGLFFGDYTNA